MGFGPRGLRPWKRIGSKALWNLKIETKGKELSMADTCFTLKNRSKGVAIKIIYTKFNGPKTKSALKFGIEQKPAPGPEVQPRQ